MKKLILAITPLLFASCLQEPELTEPTSGDADLTRTVIVGDSYMSGYQDGALYRDGQKRSIGALLFEQFGIISDEEIVQGLISDNQGVGINSKPWEGVYIEASVMGDRTDCKGVVSLGPVKTFHTGGSEQSYLGETGASDLNDFSIPFARVNDFLRNDLETDNVFYDRLDGALPFATPLDNIEDINPTFFAAWLGMEDIYEYAKNGAYGDSLTPPQDFHNALDSILGRLSSVGAKGVVATIPEIDRFPYFTTIPVDGATLTQNKADSLNDLYQQSGITHINFVEGDNAFIIDDPNAPNGFRQLLPTEYITISVPLDSMKCNFYGLLVSTIHDRYALDSIELADIRSTIASYNQSIRQLANQYDLAIFESDPFFASVQSGIKWNGQDFTTEFVSGGFFSLDGFHLNQKGAALIANEFIHSINAAYNANIPTTNCPECNGILFP